MSESVPGHGMTAEAQRRLILHVSVSLDGFVARKDGGIDWPGTRLSGVIRTTKCR